MRNALSGSLMDRDAAAQIGEAEGALSVATIGGADQLKQHIVLRDRQQRPVAEAPAVRREVAAEHPDLADIGITHGGSLVSRGEDTLQGDNEIDHEIRLPV